MTVLSWQTQSVANQFAICCTVPTDGSIEVINIRGINTSLADQCTAQYHITPTAIAPIGQVRVVTPQFLIKLNDGIEETGLSIQPGYSLQVFASTSNLVTYVSGVGG